MPDLDKSPDLGALYLFLRREVMRLIQRLVAAMFCVTASFATCSAQELRESYKAFLSERDHFNSEGRRLTSAAAIVRQDRANVHRFGIRGAEDQDDIFFADANNRAALERLIALGTSNPVAIRKIVNGTVLIRVDIYQGHRGRFVNVTVMD
jgi:hypothetical protein